MIDWLVLAIGAMLGFIAWTYYGEARTQRNVIDMIIDVLMEDEDEGLD
ncbi:MAG: hypothetical protein IKF59_04420 [Lachnospiraceae bacterium]|nr:hypothetical protein [Eubacterium sp.]MBR3187267.1 hypothetical protein [Lachnospiraceae bacterium]